WCFSSAKLLSFALASQWCPEHWALILAPYLMGQAIATWTKSRPRTIRKHCFWPKLLTYPKDTRPRVVGQCLKEHCLYWLSAMGSPDTEFPQPSMVFRLMKGRHETQTLSP
uniref:Uncharacterized protein n=1 Tax=Chrysemys picta bellii TaxID=8478 RepID=A0A8C3I0D2_CHRPI